MVGGEGRRQGQGETPAGAGLYGRLAQEAAVALITGAGVAIVLTALGEPGWLAVLFAAAATVPLLTARARRKS